MKTNDKFACHTERGSDGRHPSPTRANIKTAKEINQHTIATILHIVSFKNAFTKHTLKKNKTKNDTNKDKQSNPFWRWWVMPVTVKNSCLDDQMHWLLEVCVEGCCVVCILIFNWTCENVKQDQLEGDASQISPNYRKSVLFTAEAMPPSCGQTQYCRTKGRPNCLKNYKFVWTLPQFWSGKSISKIYASRETLNNNNARTIL